jgi:hypothetical protein
MTMFEYNKLILKKVSFDARIFKKEARKAFRNSTQEEISRLKSWWRSNSIAIQSEHATF